MIHIFIYLFACSLPIHSGTAHKSRCFAFVTTFSSLPKTGQTLGRSWINICSLKEQLIPLNKAISLQRTLELDFLGINIECTLPLSGEILLQLSAQNFSQTKDSGWDSDLGMIPSSISFMAISFSKVNIQIWRPV